MSESDTRRTFCKMIHPLDPVPIENLLTGNTGIGTPDVEFVGGWAELKYLSKWPARDSTLVRIPHYTDEQREWAKRRWAKGEMVWLVLQVRQDWVFWCQPAAQNVGFLTKDQMRDSAARWFGRLPSTSEVVDLLTRF